MAKRTSKSLSKAFIVIAIIGVLIAGFSLVYYKFHLGIKPCHGLPTDAANCGDADFGGIIFVLIGVPISLVGVLGLLSNIIFRRLNSK